jgi:hypothetical protein
MTSFYEKCDPAGLRAGAQQVAFGGYFRSRSSFMNRS